MSEQMTASQEELERRLKQQEMLAQFGVEALRCRDIENLYVSAVHLCAEGMQTPLCKLLKYRQEFEDFLVIAGVGWDKGVVGHATIGADMASPAGFALKTGLPVISNHLQAETRFRTPELMAQHGVKRAANVLISASGNAFGVLEVDSREEGEFGTADLSFLTGFANLIAVAVERKLAETQLEAAVLHQELLTREASHRVKNSLAMVTSLIALQSGRAANQDVKDALQDIQVRIFAIGKAHDQLWRHDQVGMVVLGELLLSICDRLQEQQEGVRLNLKCPEINIDADRAIPVGLLTTELITNSVKYAYPNGSGDVDISVTADKWSIGITVADHGAGVDPDWSFDNGSGNSLGRQMILSLTKQLGGKLEIACENGLAVTISIPRN